MPSVNTVFSKLPDAPGVLGTPLVVVPVPCETKPVAAAGGIGRQKILSETIRFFPNKAYVEQSDKGNRAGGG